MGRAAGAWQGTTVGGGSGVRLRVRWMSGSEEMGRACGGVEARELGQEAQARGCRLTAGERCD